MLKILKNTDGIRPSKVNRKWAALIISVVIFQILCSFKSVHSQQTSDITIKAAYISQFVQNIKWPNEEHIDSFRIAIVSGNSKLQEDFFKLLSTRSLKQSPIALKSINGSEELKEPFPHLVYIDPNSDNLVPQLSNMLIYNPTLVLTDETKYTELISINFYYTDISRTNLSFEVNSFNIERKHGLTVLPQLLLLGGTKLEVVGLYQKQEEALKQEREVVDKFREVIDNQQETIKHQNEEIDNQRKDILLQRKEIDFQQQLIEGQRVELERLVSEINLQKRVVLENQLVLKRFQEDITHKQSSLSSQSVEIEKRNRILEEQNQEIINQQDRIDEQRISLEQQAKKISEQRVMLFLSLLTILSILSMMFFIFKAYHDKKAANKLLIEKNTEIEQQKEEIVAQAELLSKTNKELEKLSIVASKTDNAIIIMNPEGKIEWVNPGFTKLTGYNESELIGRIEDYQKLASPYKKIAALFKYCLVHKQSVSYEMPFKAKDNRELCLQTTMTPIIDIENTVTSLIAISSDITELKNAQKQLVQSEKMASIGILTAGIAHEINNPINFVYAGVDSIMRDFIDIDKVLTELNNLKNSDLPPSELVNRIIEKIDKYDFYDTYSAVIQTLNDIRIGAQRTTEIVEGLRNFSRTENFKWAKVDIHILIDGVLLLLKNLYKNRIVIEKNYYSSLPEIFCMSGKLNQVFMNLIANAIDSIENEGLITITTLSNHGNAVIIIEDTGSGISEDVQHKIFDPFFTTKEIGKGVGLGLSITYAIIEEHNGTINLKTEVGKGTKFEVVLPLIPKEEVNQ